METNSPTISVLMSMYSESVELVQKSIQSLIEQSFKDWELILVDDGNNIANQKIALDFNDERIHLYINSKNLGLTKSLNKALKKAKGKYYARLDADDFCLPHRFSQQVKFLDQNPKAVLCGGQCFEIVDGKKNKPILSDKNSDSQIRAAMPFFNPLIHSTHMGRTEVMKKIGGYDESFTYSQDYDLILRLLNEGEVQNLPEELVGRNIEKNSISLSKSKAQLAFALKVRWRAIKTFYPGPLAYLQFMKSCVPFILPTPVWFFLKEQKRKRYN